MGKQESAWAMAQTLGVQKASCLSTGVRWTKAVTRERKLIAWSAESKALVAQEGCPLKDLKKKKKGKRD